jgi:hypothetical protein
VRRIQLAALLVGTLITAGAWSYPQPAPVGQRIDAEVNLALHDLAEAEQMLRYGNPAETARELGEIRARLDAIRALVGTPVVSGPIPIEWRELDSALRRLSMMWNPEDKLGFVARLADNHFFTVAQVIQISQVFYGQREKVDVIEMLAPKIVDPEHANRLQAVIVSAEGRRTIEQRFGGQAPIVVPSTPSAF